MAINTSLAEGKRAEAKVVGAKAVIDNKERETQVDILRAESYIMETKARRDVTQAALDEARRESDFIKSLMDLFRSRRLFSAHEDHVAFQLIQPIEWKYDIFWQMYSQMSIQNGQIGSELFALIKAHPDAQTLLYGLDVLHRYFSSDVTSFLKMPKSTILAHVANEEELPYLLQTSALKNALSETTNVKITYESVPLFVKEISHEV
jgi:hypothetical protein